jgi:hypothetical protein
VDVINGVMKSYAQKQVLVEKAQKDVDSLPHLPVIDDFAQGINSGIVKGIGGTVQTLADVLHLGNLGKQVGNYTDKASNAMIRQGGGDTLAGQSGQFIGQAAPLLFGGGLLGSFKVIGKAAEAVKLGEGAGKALGVVGGGAAAGAAQEESGDTTEERNTQRVSGAEDGAALSVLLGGGGALAGKLVTKLANSHAVEGPLKAVMLAVKNWKPDVSQGMAEVSAQVQNMDKQFAMRSQRLDQMVGESGGVDLSQITPKVEEARALLPQLTKDDVSKQALSSTIRALDHLVAPKGKNFEETQAQFSTPLTDPKMAPVVQKLEAQGLDLLPKAKSDFSTLSQLSSQIGDHLQNAVGEGNRKATNALLGIKSQLDQSLRNALTHTPAGQKVFDGMQSQYVDRLRPLKKYGAALLSKDPQEQLLAVHGMIDTADTDAAKVLAPMMSDSGKQNVLNLALKQGVARSINPATGHINPVKFNNFFTPGRLEVAKEFQTGKWGDVFDQLRDFVKADAAANARSHLISPQAGALASGLSSMGAAKQTVEGLLAGSVHLGLLGKVMLSHVILKGTYNILDTLANTVVGRNFIHASSKVTPNTPAWDRMIEMWRPRLTRLFAVGAINTANAPSSNSPQTPMSNQ